MPSMSLESPFTFGDRVIIDGDKSLIARVTRINFASHFCEIEISWVHNGSIQTAWVANWRLEPASA